jgi:two-component system, OmpR family, KDP operon response regulator KdpE
LPLSFGAANPMLHGVTTVRAAAILVIDDEPEIRDAVAHALDHLCDRVLASGTAAEGLELAASARPDLIVLDLGLPDMDGREVCRRIRRWSSAPVVVLSARHSETEKVELLTLGADDYVTKPFGIAEFVARIQAHLRRARTPLQVTAPLECDGLRIDLLRREVRRGELIRLTRTEWSLLQMLVMHAGRTLTHQQLFDTVWGKAFGNPQQNLRVHVTNLRRKIERAPASPRLIVTDPGVGYRFEGAVP